MNNLVETIFARHADLYESIDEFLNPDYEKLSDPFLLSDMEKAVDRILSAFEKNEKICIYADYDADGVPGACVLSDLFKKIGYENFMVYIPHRHDEGYGFHVHAIEKLKEDKIDLIVTVDVGITDLETVAKANENKIDVVITDHHEPLEELPAAYAVVNPKLRNYPDPMICGAATAFQLVRGVLKILRSEKKEIAQILIPHEGWEKWLLDLVGIATLSDMVPLVKENRILAYWGLEVLKKTRRKGLVALFQKLRMNQKYLIETDITFSITPKLNAASRMDHPMRAFELLSAQSDEEAIALATKLNSLNDKRKRAVTTAMKKVHTKLKERDLSNTNTIVIGDRDWGHGIIGLIASKIVDGYGKNAFVWAQHHDGTLKGSCRSVGEYDVHHAMSDCVDGFIQFGGHKGAGGFSATTEKIISIEEKLSKAFEDQEKGFPKEESSEEKTIAQINAHEIDYKLIEEIAKCAPYGVGNPDPIFEIRGIVQNAGFFGKGDLHISIELVHESFPKGSIRARAFYKNFEQYTLGKTPKEGQAITIIGTPIISRFLGRVSIEIQVEDIKV